MMICSRLVAFVRRHLRWEPRVKQSWIGFEFRQMALPSRQIRGQRKLFRKQVAGKYKQYWNVRRTCGWSETWKVTRDNFFIWQICSTEKTVFLLKKCLLSKQVLKQKEIVADNKLSKEWLPWGIGQDSGHLLVRNNEPNVETRLSHDQIKNYREHKIEKCWIILDSDLEEAETELGYKETRSQKLSAGVETKMNRISTNSLKNRSKNRLFFFPLAERLWRICRNLSREKTEVFLIRTIAPLCPIECHFWLLLLAPLPKFWAKSFNTFCISFFSFRFEIHCLHLRRKSLSWERGEKRSSWNLYKSPFCNSSVSAGPKFLFGRYQKMPHCNFFADLLDCFVRSSDLSHVFFKLH